MLNRVMLIGNLTRDVEMKYLPSGDGIASYGVATSRRWKDKNGERKEETEFHNITCFGALAKISSEYLKKGSKVFLEGRIKTERWEKDGQQHSRVVIIAETMNMLDSKREGGEPQSRPQQSRPTAAPQPQTDFDDDIPFASLNWQIRRHLV